MLFEKLEEAVCKAVKLFNSPDNLYDYLVCDERETTIIVNMSQVWQTFVVL